jgi:hypothetical protein
MLMIWGLAAMAYLVFLGWHENWGGKLRPDEIDDAIARMQARGADQLNDVALIRKYLTEDDGREFFMLNLVKVTPGQIPDPATGQLTSGSKVLSQYTTPFMKRLIARGGYPAMAARPVGGYIDAWNSAPDPGWTLVGYMRYRSRRDMLRLASDPAFHDIHRFKIAGTAQTFSFPTQPMILTLASPRISVALVIALIAALAQLIAR